MLHFNTDAPLMVARELVAFGNGFIEDAGSESPAWVESVMHVSDESAGAVLAGLRIGGYRVEGRRPIRPAIADPVFAMAAASIDRGNSSAPAAAFAR